MEEIEKVSLAAYEAQASRFMRIIKYMVFGWMFSVIALGLVLVISLSYTEDVYTETTTAEVMQDADNYGHNVYAGGDYYDSKTDNYDDEDDDI